MKKRWFSLLVVLAVIISLVVIGCAKPAPAEIITLKYADQNPDTGWEGSQAAGPWLKQIEEACKGKVKIEYYPAQTLCKGVDTWEALKAGTADFAWCFHGYWAGMTPLADVVTLPFMPFKSAEQGSAALWQLYEKYPSISEQFADNHVVLTWTSNPYFLATTKKPVKTLEDFKGMKIRSTGGPPTDMVKALGASPMSVPMPDTYMNLQKGVMDGQLDPWEAFYTFRHYEVAKYVTLVPFHMVYFTQSFNLDKWNSLPPDVQKAIESVSGLEGSKFWGKNMFDTAAQAVDKIVKDQGYEVTYYTPPPEEVAKWSAIAGEPLWEEWVKKMEDAGHPEARDILNTTLGLIS